MDSMKAYGRGLAAQAAGAEQRVFDWDEAARIIRRKGAKNAGVGLGEDWEWTGGTILHDGKIVPREKTYTYLSSNWAIPELDVEGEVIPCWRWEKDSLGWNAGTYWPDSARRILQGEYPLNGIEESN